MTCRDMVKIVDLVDPHMFVNENLMFTNMHLMDITPHYKESQLKLYGEALDASALIYVTMDNGLVLTGLLRAETEGKSRADGYFNCVWIPQHLFNVDRKGDSTSKNL